jgi:1-aminocyclopropane-1-carboxylate synthase
LDFTDHILGSSALLSGLSALFNDHFVPHTAVQPGHIIVGNGLSAIIEVLAEVTCDPRPPSQTFTGVNGDVHGNLQEESGVQDVWLIAKPYWAGFDEALDVHLQCRMVGVDVSDSSSSNPSDTSSHSNLSQSSTLTAFETTIARLGQQGKRARAIVLCNPHNPLGFNYPRETLEAYAHFAEKHDLHLISDEIYALSQFNDLELDYHGSDAGTGHKVVTTPFTSALSLDPHALGCDPARIHVLYGLSKDWGANGVRAAALVSQANPALLDAFRGTGMRLKCSSLAVGIPQKT